MASFPDNLPPDGLDIVNKLLIYFGILYILSTAITTWLVTRRRSFPKSVEVPAEPVQTPSQPTSTPSSQQSMVGMSQALNFDDTKDKLSSMKIEVQGAEAALEKLKELQKDDQISAEAYMKLSSRYNDIVNKIRAEMNLMLQSDIESNSGEVESGITEDEIEAIEADLEQQLLDLDNDDSFLKARPKKDLDDILGEKEQEKATPASAPATPKATPAGKPKENKRVPMPPPPKKASSVSATPPKATSSTPAAAPPKPSADKSSMVPPPPKKAQAPPPPSSSSGSKATPPAAPTSSQPLSAAQPMKVESDEDDSMFAKSTSIAALRMDMLRELARLKKLIPEDQDKDQ